MGRIEKHEYYMEIARTVAKRSTCIRSNVGAVMVSDNRIIATGYNGAPSKMPHCIDMGVCFRNENGVESGTKLETCRSVHAEQNLIAHCSFHGSSSKDSTVYCTMLPCVICAKLLINAGVSTLIYDDVYADQSSVDLFLEAGVKLISYKQMESISIKNNG